MRSSISSFFILALLCDLVAVARGGQGQRAVTVGTVNVDLGFFKLRHGRLMRMSIVIVQPAGNESLLR